MGVVLAVVRLVVRAVVRLVSQVRLGENRAHVQLNRVHQGEPHGKPQQAAHGVQQQPQAQKQDGRHNEPPRQRRESLDVPRL